MTITIIGLDPGDPAMLTRRAWDIISSASVIYVRRARHPTLEGLPVSVTVHSFDHIYEQAQQFAEVYAQVAEEVLRLGGQGDVFYCVPGHPVVGEATVTTIIQRAPELGIAVEIVDGLASTGTMTVLVSRHVVAQGSGQDPEAKP